MVSLFVPVLFLVASQSQITQDEKDVRAAVQQYASTVLSDDLGALKAMLDQGYTKTDASGMAFTLRQVTDPAERGEHEMIAYNIEDLKVHTFNSDTAVCSARIRDIEEVSEKVRDQLLQVTFVWVKSAGRWKLAAEHASEIKQGF